MKFKAVAFDIDGTLYPNRAIFLHGLLSFLGADIQFLKAFSQVRKQLRQAPPPDCKDFYHVQALFLADRLKITPEQAYSLIETRVYSHWFKVFCKIRLYPFVQETLALFRRSRLKLAVMSDFPIRHRLIDLKLEGWWDCAFSSEETGFLKPHPKPFLNLSERLGLLPTEILYVGNSYEYDVLGASAVSMPCAHLCRKPHHNTRACMTFHDWRDLQAFVLELPFTKKKSGSKIWEQKLK